MNSGDAIDTGRVANLYVPKTARGDSALGSGYLIDARKILTASHVVQGLEKGEGLFVRGIGETSLGSPGDVPNATLVWRHPGADIALVELIEPIKVLGKRKAAAARFGRLQQDGRKFGCNGVGFPGVLSTGTADNAGYTFGGLAQPIDDLKGELLIELDKAASSADRWKGLSGAAVFYRGYLIGVMRDTRVALGPYALNAEPVQKAFNDAEFCALLGNHQGSVEIPLVDEAEDRAARFVLRYACLIDRHLPATDVVNAIRKNEDEKKFPLIVSIPGPLNEMHRRFVERLGYFELRDRLAVDAPSADAIPSLSSWPRSATIDAKVQYRDWLQQELRRVLNVEPEPTLKRYAARIHERLCENPTLAGLSISIDGGLAETGRGHGSLLWRFLLLWLRVRRMGLSHSFVIFLCVTNATQPGAAPRQGGGLFARLLNKPAKVVHVDWARVLARAVALGTRLGDDISLAETAELMRLRPEDLVSLPLNLEGIMARSGSVEIDSIIKSVQAHLEWAERMLGAEFSMEDFDRTLATLLRQGRG